LSGVCGRDVSIINSTAFMKKRTKEKDIWPPLLTSRETNQKGSTAKRPPEPPLPILETHYQDPKRGNLTQYPREMQKNGWSNCLKNGKLGRVKKKKKGPSR